MHAVLAMREEVLVLTKLPLLSLVSYDQRNYCNILTSYVYIAISFRIHTSHSELPTSCSSIAYISVACSLFPSEISDIPDRTVTLGRNTTFTCSATGPGDIFYRWNRTVFDRNGVLLEIGFYNESRVTGEDISTLTVVDVGVMDEGRYTCFVSINGTNAGGKTAILSTRGA